MRSVVGDTIAAVPRISKVLRDRDRDVLRRPSAATLPRALRRRLGEDRDLHRGTHRRFAPGRALRLVRQWSEEHGGELEANWERAVRHERPQPIEPLR